MTTGPISKILDMQDGPLIQHVLEFAWEPRATLLVSKEFRKYTQSSDFYYTYVSKSMAATMAAVRAEEQEKKRKEREEREKNNNPFHDYQQSSSHLAEIHSHCKGMVEKANRKTLRLWSSLVDQMLVLQPVVHPHAIADRISHLGFSSSFLSSKIDWESVSRIRLLNDDNQVIPLGGQPPPDDRQQTQVRNEETMPALLQAAGDAGEEARILYEKLQPASTDRAARLDAISSTLSLTLPSFENAPAHARAVTQSSEQAKIVIEEMPEPLPVPQAVLESSPAALALSVKQSIPQVVELTQPAALIINASLPQVVLNVALPEMDAASLVIELAPNVTHSEAHSASPLHANERVAPIAEQEEPVAANVVELPPAIDGHAPVREAPASLWQQAQAFFAALYERLVAWLQSVQNWFD